MKAGIFHCLAGHWAISAKSQGLEIDWAFENLHNVSKFFRMNWPDVDFYGSYSMFERSIQHGKGSYADIIIGSPPCVGISTGNPQAKSGHAANQEIIRFAETVNRLQPKAFIMEMVHNFKTSKKFKELYEQYKAIIGESYNYIAPVLQLSRYGSPTKRKRVFFIGFHKNYDAEPTTPDPLHTIVTAREIFEGLPNPTEEEAVAKKQTHKWNPLWKGPYSTLAKHGQDYFTLPEDKPGRTFTAVGGVYFRHPDDHRAITKAEAKRIMGIPDSYRIPAGFSTVIRACAWGVPVMSLDIIISHVLKELESIV